MTDAMTEPEAERYIIALLLSKGPLTTSQVEMEASRESRRCPDKTVLFLTKMRQKGLIKGEVSVELRGWLWSVP